MIAEMFAAALLGHVVEGAIDFVRRRMEAAAGKRSDRELLEEIHEAAREERRRRDCSVEDLQSLCVVEVAARSLAANEERLSRSLLSLPSATSGFAGDAAIRDVIERAPAVIPGRDLRNADLSGVTIEVVPPRPPADLAGKVLSGYEIVRLLGMGGFGAVLLGRNAVGKHAALKVPHHPSQIRRVLREAQAVSRLEHPGIVSLENVVLDHAEHPHLIFEYVEGESLREVLRRRRRLPEEESEKLVGEVLDALDYAHDRGVVHLDLKPDNLMVARSSGKVKILDFGIGRVTSTAAAALSSSASLSRMGIAGTPDYMAPEQRRGERDLDGRADLYSLGVTLFELLEGYPPSLGARLQTSRPGLVAFFEGVCVDRREERAASAGIARQLLDSGSPVRPARPEHDPSGMAGEPKANVSGFWEVVNREDSSILIWVPQGWFLRGSDSDSDDEKPQRRIWLDGYWIGKHEITSEQYRRFILAIPGWRKGGQEARRGADGNYLEDWSGTDYPAGKGKHPVVCVSWNAAAAYCRWALLRLPSEAEWEKGTRGSDGGTYPWGEEDPDRRLANFGGNGGTTTAVGTYPQGASPYGALDMAGNVWEWCQDWYDEEFYARAAERNPVNEVAAPDRVYRGGSHGCRAGSLRGAYRDWAGPASTVHFLGLRAARSQ